MFSYEKWFSISIIMISIVSWLNSVLNLVLNFIGFFLFVWYKGVVVVVYGLDVLWVLGVFF